MLKLALTDFTYSFMNVPQILKLVFLIKILIKELMLNLTYILLTPVFVQFFLHAISAKEMRT